MYKSCTSSSVDRATASGAVCGGSIPLWCIFFMHKNTGSHLKEMWLPVFPFNKMMIFLHCNKDELHNE